MDQARVLIVSGEKNLRERMRIALEGVGYRVETAADGPKGLARFGNGEAWDLVLLSHPVWGLSAGAVVRQIRERDPDARVVLVTGPDASREVGTGASDLLRTPFTPDKLLRVVRAVLTPPRQRPDVERYSLRRLLPTPGPDPVSVLLFHFRTLNGLRFWPLPEEATETATVSIRRVFEIQLPSGKSVRCAVDVTSAARRLVTQAVGRDLASTDPVWDVVCRTRLSAQLWEGAELPPETLPVYTLTRAQLELVRSMAGSNAGMREC